MEMEGRGYSGFYRNTSEEIFLKSLMENSVGMPTPTMEMLGFKNLSNNLRTDSEELFKSWLTSAENHGYNSPSMAHHRQASRRISTELANTSNLQNGDVLEKKRSNDNLLAESSFAADDISGNLKNAEEKEWQGSNLYLAKAWFHSSQPMTRSRSSELRRRYVAMQNAQTSIGMEAMLNSAGPNDTMKQEFAGPSGFSMNQSISETPEQLRTFVSPSNSSSSTFNAQGVDNLDQISSVVSMLKGTLERKKLASQIDTRSFVDVPQGLYPTQDVPANNSDFDQGQGSHVHDMSAVFKEASPDQVKNFNAMRAVEETIDLDFGQFVNGANPIQSGMFSHEPSQSESSAAAPVISSGFDACDGPSYSSQALTVCESSRKHAGSSGASQNGSRAKDIRERIIDNLKEDSKRSLARYNSITSAGSDKGDSTKKRRVERSRKMAEAKERNSTSTIPSDMQTVLKRCENLEKEVRSLKLNLSFMNRKDSEQTKQIEELQKQNEDLAEEKERLLEEIERILMETGHK